MPDTHRLTPANHSAIADLPTDGRDFHSDRETAEAEFKKLRRELIELQYRLYAEGKQKLLVVFQAMDAGGKDGTIRKVFRGVNPQGVEVTSYKKPTKEELSHDYLWRIHKAVPGKGMIGIFNRSHYEDVLVVRVDNLVPEKVWSKRYEQINQFEQLLHENGTTILKFFLNISKEEQRGRLQDRLDDETKNWKFELGDLEKRKQWEDYMVAYEAMLNKTTTRYAPWYVIPANQKWYRNLAITRAIVGALQRMNPQYPIQTEDLTQIKIE